jgi:hypothetical protein
MAYGFDAGLANARVAAENVAGGERAHAVHIEVTNSGDAELLA